MSTNLGWLSRKGEKGDELPFPFNGHDVLFIYGKPSHVAAYGESIADAIGADMSFIPATDLANTSLFPEPYGSHIIIVNAPDTLEEIPEFLKTLHDKVFPEYATLDLPENPTSHKPSRVVLSRPRLEDTHVLVGIDPRLINYRDFRYLHRDAQDELSGQLHPSERTVVRDERRFLFDYPDPADANGKNKNARVVLGPLTNVSSFNKKYVEKHLEELLQLGPDAGLEEGWNFSHLSVNICDENGLVDASEFLELYKEIERRLGANIELDVPQKVAIADAATGEWNRSRATRIAGKSSADEVLPISRPAFEPPTYEKGFHPIE